MVVSRPASPCPGPAKVLALLLAASLAGAAPAGAGAAPSAAYELVVLAEPSTPAASPRAGDLTLSYRVVEVFAGDPGSVSIVVTHRDLEADQAGWLQHGARVILLVSRDPEAPGRWQGPFPVKATPKAIDSFRSWSAPPDVRPPRDVGDVVKEARGQEPAPVTLPTGEDAVSPAADSQATPPSLGPGSAPGPRPSDLSSAHDAERVDEVLQEEPPRIEELAEDEREVLVSEVVEAAEPEPVLETEQVEPRAVFAAVQDAAASAPAQPIVESVVPTQDPEAPQVEDTVWDSPAEESVNLLSRSTDTRAMPEAVEDPGEEWQVPAAFPARASQVRDVGEPTYMARRKLVPDPGPGLPPIPTSAALGPKLSERSDLRVVKKRD